MGHFPWSKVIPYLVAQHLGGFVAGAAIYTTFYDPIQSELAKHAANSTLGYEKLGHMFCSFPAAHASNFGSFYTSFWATAVFLIGIAAVLDQVSAHKTPKWFWPLGVAFVLMVSLVAFGSNGGPSVNPAADLPTRIFASLVGFKGVMFAPQNGNHWWIVGLLGPHLGAIFGLWFYRFCISSHYPPPEPQNSAEMQRLNKS
jgi:glycerol uptake facilitator-like aquaporin